MSGGTARPQRQQCRVGPLGFSERVRKLESRTKMSGRAVKDRASSDIIEFKLVIDSLGIGSMPSGAG